MGIFTPWKSGNVTQQGLCSARVLTTNLPSTPTGFRGCKEYCFFTLLNVSSWIKYQKYLILNNHYPCGKHRTTSSLTNPNVSSPYFLTELPFHIYQKFLFKYYFWSLGDYFHPITFLCIEYVQKLRLEIFKLFYDHKALSFKWFFFCIKFSLLWVVVYNWLKHMY